MLSSGSRIIFILLLAAIIILYSSAIAEKNNINVFSHTMSSNTFALDLFQNIAQNDYESNIIISPVSVRYAIAMLYNGAAGKTREEIKTALGFEKLSDQEINNYFFGLTRLFDMAGSPVKLNMANSIWILNYSQIKQEFIDLVNNIYDAEIGQAESPLPINAWVSKKTNNKINKIIENINPLDVMYLINAVYFQGEWLHKFDSSETRLKDFNYKENKAKTIPFMSQTGDFSYFEDNDMQSIILPYNDNRLCMHIFLPLRYHADFKSFISKINKENWMGLTGKYSEAKGTVYLPKFKFEYEKILNSALKEMGINDAFSMAEANLTNMIYGIAFVSKVKQNIFIETDEVGTKAAAVTMSVVRVCASRSDSKQFVMLIERWLRKIGQLIKVDERRILEDCDNEQTT